MPKIGLAPLDIWQTFRQRPGRSTIPFSGKSRLHIPHFPGGRVGGGVGDRVGISKMAGNWGIAFAISVPTSDKRHGEISKMGRAP